MGDVGGDASGRGNLLPAPALLVCCRGKGNRHVPIRLTRLVDGIEDGHHPHALDPRGQRRRSRFDAGGKTGGLLDEWIDFRQHHACVDIAPITFARHGEMIASQLEGHAPPVAKESYPALFPATVTGPVERPGNLQIERAATFEINQRMGGIFHIADPVKFGRSSPHAFVNIIPHPPAKVRIDLAADPLDRRKIEQPADQIEDMHANVDQRSSPGEPLVGEPASQAGHTPPPVKMRLGMIDFAQIHRLNHLPGGLPNRRMTMDHADLQQTRGLVRNVDRLLALGRVEPHRFFQQHVLARPQRFDGQLPMPSVGDADDHRIDRIVRQQRCRVVVSHAAPSLAIPRRHPIQHGRQTVRRLPIWIRHRNHRLPGCLGRFGVDLANRPRADNPQSNTHFQQAS